MLHRLRGPSSHRAAKNDGISLVPAALATYGRNQNGPRETTRGKSSGHLTLCYGNDVKKIRFNFFFKNGLKFFDSFFVCFGFVLFYCFGR